MEIEVAIQRLEAAELTILPRIKPSGEGWITIARAIDPIDEGDGIGSLVDGSIIFYQDGNWVFRKWDWVPGPGYDDIDFRNENLEVILNVAIEYYFGEPILIDNWILPLHKHPEWSATRLPVVIESAKRITVTEWDVIRAPYTQRRWQLHPQGTLVEIFACLFNPITNSQYPDLTLYLRRDLAEAFIVDRGV